MQRATKIALRLSGMLFLSAVVTQPVAIHSLQMNVWDYKNTPNGRLECTRRAPRRQRGTITTDGTYMRMHNHQTLCWRRGSVVRTSVFGWRTFPDLRLIYGWHVTTSWVRCTLWVIQPDQLSLPSLLGR